MFKAPQKPLRTSWVQLVYSKPKSLTIVKKSLGPNPTAMIKSRGKVASNTAGNSNEY
jgi:hypothetical protein